MERALHTGSVKALGFLAGLLIVGAGFASLLDRAPAPARAQSPGGIDLQGNRDMFAGSWYQNVGAPTAPVSVNLRWWAGLSEGTNYVGAIWCNLNDTSTNWDALNTAGGTPNRTFNTSFVSTANSGYGNGWGGAPRACSYSTPGTYTIKLFIGTPDVYGSVRLQDTLRVTIPGSDDGGASQGMSCSLSVWGPNMSLESGCVGQETEWILTAYDPGHTAPVEAFWYGTKDNATDVTNESAGNVTGQGTHQIITYRADQVGTYTRYFRVPAGNGVLGCTSNTVTMEVRTCAGGGSGSPTATPTPTPTTGGDGGASPTPTPTTGGGAGGAPAACAVLGEGFASPCVGTTPALTASGAPNPAGTSLDVSVDLPAMPYHAIWRDAYYYNKATSEWQVIQLSGTPYAADADGWFKEHAAAGLTVPTANLPMGENYVVSWEYTWNPDMTKPGETSPGCWVGPDGTQCEQGMWRGAKFTVQAGI